MTSGVEEDLTGLQFGKLRVISRTHDYISPKQNKHYKRYIVECSCENKHRFQVRATHLKSGATLSCGCLRVSDLKGKVFDRLTVIGFDKIKGEYSYWLCRCDCGNIVSVRGSSLSSGTTRSCGCISKHVVEDLTGKIFGMLKVLSFDKIESTRDYWICLCECGNTKSIRKDHLVSGNTNSCGCLSESYVASKLKDYFSYNYNAIPEYRILKNPDTNRWLSFDIYIPNNIFVEVHGEQHYSFVPFWHKSKEQFEYNKKLDSVKKRFAKKSGQYIEVDLRKIKTTEQAIQYIESLLR